MHGPGGRTVPRHTEAMFFDPSPRMLFHVLSPQDLPLFEPDDNIVTHHIRPYLPENLGSRPLSFQLAGKGQTSSWV